MGDVARTVCQRAPAGRRRAGRRSSSTTGSAARFCAGRETNQHLALMRSTVDEIYWNFSRVLFQHQPRRRGNGGVHRLLFGFGFNLGFSVGEEELWDGVREGRVGHGDVDRDVVGVDRDGER